MSRLKMFSKSLASLMEHAEVNDTFVLGRGRRITIHGFIPVGRHSGRVQVEVDPQKPRLFQVPPVVRLPDPWIRREIGWHAFPNPRWNNKVCWIHQKHWTQLIRCSSLTRQGQADAAAFILHRWVKQFLTYHRIGHDKGLTTWPQSWPDLPHG